ncbi:MAG: hypothetical protein WBA10_04745 [Elainellaceae cyanobacterium]
MTEQVTNDHTEAPPETNGAPESAKSSNGHAIELKGSRALAGRPIGHDDNVEIVDTMSFSGIRPIGASHLDIYDTMMGGRPIEANHLAIVHSDTLPGHRPVFANQLSVIDDDTLPEHRPIMSSPGELMEGSSLPNNRPIARNDIFDVEGIMGYLD